MSGSVAGAAGVASDASTARTAADTGARLPSRRRVASVWGASARRSRERRRSASRSPGGNSDSCMRRTYSGGKCAGTCGGGICRVVCASGPLGVGLASAPATGVASANTGRATGACVDGFAYGMACQSSSGARASHHARMLRRRSRCPSCWAAIIRCSCIFIVPAQRRSRWSSRRSASWPWASSVW